MNFGKIQLVRLEHARKKLTLHNDLHKDSKQNIQLM